MIDIFAEHCCRCHLMGFFALATSVAPTAQNWLAGSHPTALPWLFQAFGQSEPRMAVAPFDFEKFF
jgi:hypothetical protein